MMCADLHKALEAITARYEKDQVVVVVDEKVSRLPESDRMFKLCKSYVCRVSEAQKSIETVQHIWDFFFEQGLTRKGLVVAIGGGVLTDLVGFAAATYKRGVDYVNIPTTLLAMIDASTGGKTGINYHGLKNSIGVFAPPVETLIYPGWLKTLPAKEFLSGFGEMLKTGLLNTKLWPQLMQYDLDAMETEALVPLIEQSIAVKERIVAADPKEEGLRKALNLGHTFGHALEEVIGLTNEGIRELGSEGMPHGYAVVYGLIAEMYLSVTKLGCSKAPLQQLTQIMLHYYGKPQCKCSDRERLLSLMQQDKKNEHAGEINCTLIRQIGSPQVNQVITTDEALEALDYLFSL